MARYCSFIERPTCAPPGFKQIASLRQRYTEGHIGKQRARRLARLEAATRDRHGFGTNPSCDDCDMDKYVLIKWRRNLHLGSED